jgi:hypothetical protein
MREISGEHVVSGITYTYSATLQGAQARYFYSNAIVTADTGQRGYCLERPAVCDENAAASEDAVRVMIQAAIVRLHEHLQGSRRRRESGDMGMRMGVAGLLVEPAVH